MSGIKHINIVGAGLAGLSAAITLAEKGIECNLISVQTSERAQSVLAEGGINAALDTMGEGDSIEEHFADTMRGGGDLADPNAVESLTRSAPELVNWLVSIGVPFQMSGGKPVLRPFGGQKKKRTAYAKSSTGKVIMSALIDEARKYEASGKIHRYPHHEAIDLLTEGQDDARRCVGVKVLDTYTDERLLFHGAVILATGGLNGIFPEMTTGTVQNRGDLAALAFANGVAFASLEFLQYHPTTVGIAGKRMLVSEAARGEGGRLYVLRNGQPWYFMEELYPELGNLMPRDVVSREMVKVCARGDCGDTVYLDMTELPKETWSGKLSDLQEEMIRYLATDPAKEPIAVSPGIHFFMGGIAVDEAHRTNLTGLYAAGECACQYHGANRLGGNSMLGAIYGGKIAAKSAAEGNFDGEDISFLGKMLAEEKAARVVSAVNAKRLRELLLDGLGIVRNGENIQKSLDAVNQWQSNESLTLAERRRILLGKAMLLSALARQESRGAHYRTDYPERDDKNFRKTTAAMFVNEEIKIEFQAISEKRSV